MADLLAGVTHPALDFPIDLRAVLGMPPDALLVHLTIGNVGEYIRRLDGCQWLLIGAPVPYRTKDPSYPALLPDEGDHGVALQIWLWRVFNPCLPVYGELRWHPVHGERLSIGGLSPSFGDDDIKLVRRWLQTTRRGIRSGRRLKSGAFRDKADFVDTLVPLIRRCLAEGEEPTQPCMAKYLARLPRFNPKSATQWRRHTDSTARLIRDYCQSSGILWEELVRLAEIAE